jgi:3-dehydrosphinganine reductase
MKFEGRHALVTGGSSGIGLAIAKELAGAGCHVHIAARRRDVLEQAASSMRCEAHVCDVASRAEVAALFRRLRDAGAAPSIVVNSAGMSCAGYFREIAVADFERTMQINFFGTLYVTREAVGEMVAAKDGCILNVSSVAGLMGVFGMSPYCASKFAVCGLTQTLRSEMKPHGVSVCLLCPPDTDTPMLQAESGNPVETRALSNAGGVLSADRVARDAIRGMRRGTPNIVPGMEAKVVTLARRFVPGLVERVEDRIIRRAASR